MSRSLKARFDAAALRGDKLHQQEEARFPLASAAATRRARCALARENWTLQREPRDARVLLEAALAARRSGGRRAGARMARASPASRIRACAGWRRNSRRAALRFACAPAAASLLRRCARRRRTSRATATWRSASTGARIDGQWDIALRDLDFAIGLDAERRRRDHLGRAARAPRRDRRLCAGAADAALDGRAVPGSRRRATGRRPQRRRLHGAALRRASAPRRRRASRSTTRCSSTSTRSTAACCASGSGGHAHRDLQPRARPPAFRTGRAVAAAPVPRLRARRRLAHLDRLRPHPVPAVAAAAGGAARAGTAAGRRSMRSAPRSGTCSRSSPRSPSRTRSRSASPTLGVVTLPSRLVESAIALSVVARGVEQSASRRPRPALGGRLPVRSGPRLRFRERADGSRPAAGRAASWRWSGSTSGWRSGSSRSWPRSCRLRFYSARRRSTGASSLSAVRRWSSS